MRGSAITHRVAALAARQHGNVTFDQLRESGLDAKQIQRRADAGVYIRRHTSVYAVGHVPRSRASRFRAAVMALEPALLSHSSAGAMWEVVRGAVLTEVTIDPARSSGNRDGIVVHRSHVPEAHRDTRDGIPVTSLVRTLLDLASVFKGRRLAWAFEEAQVLHHLAPEVLAAEVACRSGYRGNARLRHLLADAVDPAGVRSILELRFLRMCAAHGVPRPEVNVSLDPWTVDFYWPQFALVVETDGDAFHRTAAKRRRDARKDLELTALGLTVIRLRWVDVVETPAASAQRILALMRAVSDS